MVWVAILVLFVWLIVEHNRANGFATELAKLQRLAAGLPPTPVWAPTPTTAPPAAAPAPPILRPASAPAPATLAASAARPAPAPREPRIARGAIEAWLSERGLAWIGGSALVIGGAFLVGYAAQHGFFTPPLRIAAATLLGLLLVGAGEAIRRGRLAGFGGHKLAAGVCAGSGAAVLYGTAWAAFGLYHFVSAPVCAGLLAAIAAGLMGLAALNGEALAVLALGGAFAVPLIARGDHWPIETTTAYLGILIAAGASVAWLRRWPAAAWANIVGVMLWALVAAGRGESWKCLLLGLEPLAVATALAYVRPRRLGAGVGAGLSVAASLAAFFALTAIRDPFAAPLGLLAGLALPALAAAQVRKDGASALALVAPGAAFAFAATLGAVMRLDPPGAANADWLRATIVWAVQIAALCAAGAWARGPGPQRSAAAIVGAVGAAATGCAASLGFAGDPFAPAPPALAAAAAFALAVLALRDRREGHAAHEHEVLAAIGSAALLEALAVATSWRFGPFVFAAAALGFAAAARRLGWRSLAGAAAASAGIGAAALLTPHMLQYALGGGAPGAAWILVAGLAVGGGAFAAARLAAGARWASEALRTISPIAALGGAFLALHWAAGAHTAVPFDDLSEAAVRTVLIAAAGLAALAGLRREREPLPFARWRAHGLMATAAAHAVLFQGLLLNPRWSDVSDYAGGVIFLNALAAAYLAPAALFAVASARSYRRSPLAGRIYALLAAGFAALWALEQARSSFHGPRLAGDLDTVGTGEALGGALALIGIVVLADWLKTATGYLKHPFAADAARSLTAGRTIAVLYALLVPGLWSNPWFGPAAAPLATPYAAVPMVAGYGLLALLLGQLALDARKSAKPLEADWITRAAILLGLLAASLAVRAGFHPADLRWAAGTPEAETWAYSALWAAIGLGFIGASRWGGRILLRAGLAVLMITTAKVFIIDTASLSGVIRAGSFLALGALLVMGALTARRVGRGPGAPTATAG